MSSIKTLSILCACTLLIAGCATPPASYTPPPPAPVYVSPYMPTPALNGAPV